MVAKNKRNEIEVAVKSAKCPDVSSRKEFEREAAILSTV